MISLQSALAHQTVTGLMLSGGQSRRMGQPKALLLFEQQTLIERVVHNLLMYVPSVFLAAGKQRYDCFASLQAAQRVVYADDVQAGDGTLLAIANALEQMSTDWLWVMPCDTLLLPTQLVDYLLTRYTNVPPHAQVVCFADHQNNVHPLMGWYHRSMLAYLQDYLQQGQRRVMVFLAQPSLQDKVIRVSFDTLQQQCCNLNTPEDFSAATAAYKVLRLREHNDARLFTP